MISGVHRGDGRALTPVVGILLLLALTLILGLTVASFVVAMSEEPTDKPTAAFEFTLEEAAGGSETVQIGHSAGDNIQSHRLDVVVDGATCTGGADDPDGRYNVDDDFQIGTSEMASGMTVRFGSDIDLDGNDEVCSGGDLDLQGATFRVVWAGPGGNNVEMQRWTA
jgi:FlaG/FlaF family flagellin (archaellin)